MKTYKSLYKIMAIKEDTTRGGDKKYYIIFKLNTFLHSLFGQWHSWDSPYDSETKAIETIEKIIEADNKKYNNEVIQTKIL